MFAQRFLVYICFRVSLSPTSAYSQKNSDLVSNMAPFSNPSLFDRDWRKVLCFSGGISVESLRECSYFGLHSSAREDFWQITKKKRRDANLWISVRRRQLGRKLSVALQKLGSQNKNTVYAENIRKYQTLKKGIEDSYC